MLPGRKYTPNDILRLLRRSGWKIALPFIACTFIALLVSRSQPSQYKSDALIQIVPQRVPDSYVRSTVTTDLDERLKSIQQQIMSRTRLEQTIEEFNLYPELRKGGTMEDAVEAMRTKIEVILASPGTPRPRNAAQVDAFRVQFTYHDPKIAMIVTGRLASWFIGENSRLRGMQADATSAFLESQLKDAKTRLEAQEQKVREFREVHAGRLPSQLQTTIQQMQSLQLQLQALVERAARSRDRRLLLERLNNDNIAEDRQLSAAPPPATPAQPGQAATGGTARQQLEAARQQLTQLELRLTPEHPDVTSTKRRIADLEKAAAAEAQQQASGGTAPVATTPQEQQRRERIRSQSAEIESLGRQIAFDEQEERRLRAQLNDYQARVEAVPATESEGIALTRDYETLQETYRSLLTKSQDSKLAANLERQPLSEQFQTLDPPRFPDRPVSPNRLMITAIGAALGLFLGVGFVGFLEFMDSSFRTDADVMGALSLPVLAVVPMVVTAVEQRQAVQRRRLAAIGAAALAVVAGGMTWYLELWKYAA